MNEEAELGIRASLTWELAAGTSLVGCHFCRARHGTSSSSVQATAQLRSVFLDWYESSEAQVWLGPTLALVVNAVILTWYFEHNQSTFGVG